MLEKIGPWLRENWSVANYNDDGDGGALDKSVSMYTIFAFVGQILNNIIGMALFLAMASWC